MKQKLLSFIFVFACFIGVSNAQNRQVSGRVTSATDGTSLSGVSVSVVGGNNATQTDASGNYSLSNVPANGTLQFSFVGYTAVRQEVNNRAVVNVQLAGGDEAIDEVVVVGYGTTTREAFTGSAKRINADRIQSKSVTDLSKALAGEVAGVSVINNSGQPGATADIRIRGFGSVNGNRAPLYVIDGVPYTGNAITDDNTEIADRVDVLSSLNNSDIESLTVLKDAAATAIYGSRGANGVVVITTRSGRGQKSFVEADVNFGVNMALLPRYDVIKNPEEFIGLAWEGYYNQSRAILNYDDQQAINFANGRIVNPVQGSLNIWDVANGGDLIDPVTRTVRAGVQRKFSPENWEDYAFQNSNRSDINVKFGGSSDKTNYFTSYGYLNDKGYSINSGFERFSGRINLDHQVKPWLNVGLNLSATKSERNNAGLADDSSSIFWFIDNMPSVYPLFERDADGNKIDDPIYGGYIYDYGENSYRRFGSLTNAIADATYGVNRHKRNELNGRGYLNFNIAEGLTFENSLGYQYYNNNHISKNDKFYGSSASTNGSLFQRNTEFSFYNLLNLIRYRKSFEDHSFEALIAHEATSHDSRVTTTSGNQMVDPHGLDFNNVVVTNPNGGYSEQYGLESYFGQVNYDYQGKYLLSGSLRRDGSSRFVKNKWGTFGSVGAGWVLTRESFLEANDFLDFLKLKASYGIIGDQAGVGFYPGYDLFNIVNVIDEPGFSFDTKGNPDLTWETSKMFQTGLEFRLGNYLTGSVEYYVKNTDNLIFERRVGPSIGYALLQVNGGSLRNRGLEFDLTGHIIKGNDYFLNLSVNGETFSNKLTAMPIDPNTGQQKTLDIQGRYGWSVGHSIFDFYMRDFVGVDPMDGRSMWKVYYTDNNGNGQLDEGEQIPSLNQFDGSGEVSEGTTKSYAQATQHYTGHSAIPKLRGAVNLSGGYKNFTLAVQMLYSFGGYAYDEAYAALMGNGTVGGNNWHRDIFQRWQQEGDLTTVPRISNNAATDQNVSSSSTRFLTKANYLALNNVRLGYNFSSNLISNLGLSNLGLWVAADNLWIHSARRGFNPTTHEAGSSDMYRYSPMSTISAGLRAKF